MAKKTTTKGIGVGKRAKTTVSMRPSDEWSAEPQTIMRIDEIAQMISDGKSRSTIQKYIKDNYGVKDAQARTYYRAALRVLIPDEDKYDEYRKALIQANIDRLEKMIEKNIDGNRDDMKLAKECISELNKLIGMGDKTNIMINRNDNEETFVIQIDK